MVWITRTKGENDMNNNTNEDGKFPRTGKPAHNNAKARSEDSLSLSDKYPAYEPHPSCIECGGEGKIWHQIARYDHYGDAELDYDYEPCQCIFDSMKAFAYVYLNQLLVL